MSFFATPIFTGLLTILLPGIIIAYVLPMIPWVMWMAGVCGWIILVCEAMIAVPLWMLAHMTVGGDGLHGRAIEGWSLLFNVVFRPTLMVIVLFLGYFAWSATMWRCWQACCSIWLAAKLWACARGRSGLRARRQTSRRTTTSPR
jgi:conjugal transfer/type IV secretion protein DotA/TraY